MGFWIFMLIMNLLVPITMIGFGKIFLKKPPKKINMIFGYRTARSMKNQDTWTFAHKYIGKIWYVCGLILLPVTVVLSIMTFGKSEDFVGTASGFICVVQLIPLIGAILPTEMALQKNFDKNGERR